VVPQFTRQHRILAALALSAAAFAWLYAHVFAKLAHDWATDGNYSHGFLIAPLTAYFVWQRLPDLQRLPLQPSRLGALVVIASLMCLVAGTLGAELFLTRISIVGVLAGAVLFLGGWAHLRVVAFPLLFLLLMIPLPAIIFNQIVLPLQLIASQLGATVLYAAGIPVLREGNVIVLARTSLEVAEACSGIRSLVSLLTLGIVLGYFTDQRAWVRTSLSLATVPITILTNGLRVAGMGLVAHYYGTAAAEGFMHAFSGWLVFAVALAMLFGLQRALSAARPAFGAAVARSVWS